MTHWHSNDHKVLVNIYMATYLIYIIVIFRPVITLSQLNLRSSGQVLVVISAYILDVNVFLPTDGLKLKETLSIIRRLIVIRFRNQFPWKIITM